MGILAENRLFNVFGYFKSGICDDPFTGMGAMSHTTIIVSTPAARPHSLFSLFLMHTFVVPPPGEILTVSCHGLVEKARLPGGRDKGSSPVPTEDLQYAWALVTLKHKPVVPLEWCGILRGECQFRCRARHQTMVQNCKVRPKIVLVFLQNWTLIK
ncbi:hypothetical protein AVEN_6018-1 [Araneus ventricosus]|uniref:Uncharacterized protein n=1 Tax=Araneus ventricosus TaxID=182803 RepID=A0A4Y2K731_ARAVE|nr:hypothetical protein AVEN_6018-1 [Araneus ventricosus]